MCRLSFFLLLDGSSSGVLHLLVLVIRVGGTLELGRGLGSTLGDATGLDSYVGISIRTAMKVVRRCKGKYLQSGVPVVPFLGVAVDFLLPPATRFFMSMSIRPAASASSTSF